MKPILPIAALTLALVVSPVWAGPHSIVPGVGIGQVRLGQSLDEVNARLGPADRGDAAMGKAWSTWFSKPGTSTAPLNRLDIY